MKRTLSTSAIAQMLGVSVGSIANWIDKGEIKAARTPGGHRRVELDELVRFLCKHDMPIPPELPGATPKVLIVDDETSVTEYLLGLIESHWPACEVMDAHDGFTAGELLATMRPDVVVLDLGMVGIDGFEVCRRIKARPETRQTVVIAVTASTTPETEAKSLSCGMKVCLPKPLDSDALVKVLAEALSGRSGMGNG